MLMIGRIMSNPLLSPLAAPVTAKVVGILLEDRQEQEALG